MQPEDWTRLIQDQRKQEHEKRVRLGLTVGVLLGMAVVLWLRLR